MTLIPGDPCNGPNHGNPHALPDGTRRWVKGQALSLTQEVRESDFALQSTFCGADCMCDWHGANVAAEQNFIESGAEFEIPGIWTLVWITPVATTIGRYESFAALTEKIGEFQQSILAVMDRFHQSLNDLPDTTDTPDTFPNEEDVRPSE